MNMRASSPFSGFFRWLAPLLLCMIACGGVGAAQTTTFTGKVFSPNGPTSGDPIPNILVFAVDPNYPPPTFTQGLTQPTGTQTGCEAQPPLVPQNVLGSALTDYSGSYTFTTTGALPTTNVTIVIQAGKWRRQYTFPTTTFTAGTTNTVPSLTMPGMHGVVQDPFINMSTVADLPHIAIVTGSVDAVECIFNQIGIQPSEFTNQAGTGSVNIYQGTASGGAENPDSATIATSPETTLVASEANLDNYDVVMFGCQGTATQTQAVTTANEQNLVNYSALGGRIFATHWEYIWLATISPFSTTADWNPTGTSSAPGTQEATIDQTYPEGAILANWMQYIKATTTLGQISLNNTDVNTSGVNNPPSQSWVTLNSATYKNASMQFTFDTPIGAAGTPTVTIAYTNVTTSFLQGDTLDTVNVVVTNTSTTATQPGLKLTITLPGGLTLVGNPTGIGANTNWTCSGLVCTNSYIAAGGVDSVQIQFSIAPATPAGQVSLSASLSGGGLSGTSQCGRVLYNDYHVESSTISKTTKYPAECTAALEPGGVMSNQEKFLEFGLYNLSNFVSPSTSDLITIQGISTVAWNPTPNSIPYGTLLTGYGTGTMLDASATDVDINSTVAGAFVYAYNGTAVNTTSTLLPAGNDTLTATFTPSSTADYTTPAPYTTIIQVTPDATTTTLTDPNPSIYYGQIIGQFAVEGVTTSGPGVLDGGNYDFYIDTTLACVLPVLGTVTTCPPPTGVGYDVGTYTMYTVYVPADPNFTTSTSPVQTVVVNPDPTATTIVSSLATSTPGQAVTFTATVGDVYAAAVGTVTFLDGPTAIGTGTVGAGQTTATVSVSNLIVGPHNITACYAPAVDAVGTYDFVASCSPGLLEIVTFPPTTIPTVTLLSSNLNPSVVGQNVTFSASVATTGAFVSVPAGGLNFFDGTTLLGRATLDANGNATLSTSGLTPGLHNITAQYNGQSNVQPSVSPVVPQQVNSSVTSAGNGFMMTVTPTTFSVGAGSSLSVGITVLELNDFNQPVQLSCSGLPSEATCTFLSSLIPVSGGTTQLIVSAAAPHNCNSSTPYFVAEGGRTGLPLFAVVALVFFARRRRMLKGLALAAVICLLPVINGCSGTCTDLGLKPGTYTFTVTGTSTGTPVVTQTQTMTMTVTI